MNDLIESAKGKDYLAKSRETNDHECPAPKPFSGSDWLMLQTVDLSGRSRRYIENISRK